MAFSTAMYVVMAAAAVYQGAAANANYKHQAKIADVNAKTAREQANAREELVRRNNADRLGRQRAIAAQSGFDPQSGTLLSLQGEGAANAELDALHARYDGASQALNFQNEGEALRIRGKNAQTSGYISAASTLFGGATRNFGRYGPGFSGTQAPAPVEDRSTYRFYGYGDKY